MYQFAIHDDPLLPVHDSFIAKKGNELYLHQLMLDTFERVTKGKTRVDVTPSLPNEGFKEVDGNKDYSKAYVGQEILDKYISDKDPSGDYSSMNRYLESWKKDYSKE